MVSPPGTFEVKTWHAREERSPAGKAPDVQRQPKLIARFFFFFFFA